MKKIFIVLFVFILSSCSMSDAQHMDDILEDMILHVTGNAITEEAFCNSAQYGNYFDESNDEFIQCAGIDGYFAYLTGLNLNYYTSTNDFTVSHDNAGLGILVFDILENGEYIIISITTLDEPYIIKSIKDLDNVS